MENREKEIAVLNFLLQKQVVYTIIFIIIFILLCPFFHRVIERTRLSFLYSKIKRIADRQVSYNTSNNTFSDSFSKLDIEYEDNRGYPFKGAEAQTGNFVLNLGKKGIFAVNKKEGYIVYYDYILASLYCAPNNHYICRNIRFMPREFCLEADMIWSDKTNACYMEQKDLCVDLGMPWDSKVNDGFCGYKNTPEKEIFPPGICIGTIPSGCQNSIVYKDASCQGFAPFACIGSKLQGGNCIVGYDNACHSVQVYDGSFCNAGNDFYGNFGCANAIVNNGGTCLASGENLLGCNKAIINNGGMCRGYALQSCNNTVIFSGGICEGNISTACQDITVKSGGRCIANTPKTCTGVYEIGSCCHGDFCPDNSPKCDCPNFATRC